MSTWQKADQDGAGQPVVGTFWIGDDPNGRGERTLFYRDAYGHGYVWLKLIPGYTAPQRKSQDSGL